MKRSSAVRHANLRGRPWLSHGKYHITCTSAPNIKPPAFHHHVFQVHGCLTALSLHYPILDAPSVIPPYKYSHKDLTTYDLFSLGRGLDPGSVACVTQFRPMPMLLTQLKCLKRQPAQPDRLPFSIFVQLPIIKRYRHSVRAKPSDVRKRPGRSSGTTESSG